MKTQRKTLAVAVMAAVATAVVTRPPLTVDATIASEVEPIAHEIAADDATRDRIASLTQLSFDELMAELEARATQGSTAESQDEVIARKQRELHERILHVLTPAQQSRYR